MSWTLDSLDDGDEVWSLSAGQATGVDVNKNEEEGVEVDEVVEVDEMVVLYKVDNRFVGVGDIIELGKVDMRCDGDDGDDCDRIDELGKVDNDDGDDDDDDADGVELGSKAEAVRSWREQVSSIEGLT